ncbi:MAG: ribonuclease E/G, partial [Deltaproteobacteria bacterium]
MGNELIVNVTTHETRVALIENGSVAELYIERAHDKGIVGNIYKGKVVRVLPGMQAAFVDIGLEKAAFLYVKDVLVPEKRIDLEEEATPAVDEDFEEGSEMEIPEAPTIDEAMHLTEEQAPSATEAQPEVVEPEEIRRPQPPPIFRNHDYKRNYGHQEISELLKEGEEILVQATKNPIGTKGARLTMFISIPGRNLVLMPAFRHVGVSRRIPSEKERRRLRDLVYNFCPKDVGVIVRTACENKRASVIKSDLDYLLKIWREVEKDLANAPAPYLLHEELDIVLRTLRDMFIDNIDRIIVDSKKEDKQILRFLEHFNPNLKRA